MRGAAPAWVFVLALTLSGCGGGDHKSLKAAPETPSCFGCGLGTEIFDPEARGPYAVPGAVGGGRVTVLTDHGLDGTLDPAGASDPAAVSILSGLVTRSLTQFRYDPQTHQMVLVPDLATDLGHHNDAYTKWVYTLRQGARFEDGTRVTADDVARGIRRCLRGRAFPTSPCLENGPIRQVRSHGNDLTFFFARPFPDLPYLAAMPALGPVPAGTPSAYGDYAEHPVATGPYKIQSYRRGHSLVLVRNDEWVPRTDPARTQYPDEYDVQAGIADRRIERVLLSDDSSARTTLTMDALDPAPFQESRALRKRLVLGPNPCTTYLSPDLRTVTDPRVRRALIWAYPYAAAVRAADLAPGYTAIPATNLLPPGVPGRTAIRVRHHHGFETSPRVAHRMLAGAGALGTRLRFHSPDGAAAGRLEHALVRSLRRSGFDPQPVRGGPVDLSTRTRCGDWPSGQQWLKPVYGGVHVAPVVARRMDAIIRTPFDQQQEFWNRLDHDVLKLRQPVVPLWYGGVAMAHGSRIEGMHDDAVRGMPTWGSIWVDQ